jgi:metal-responsive CopG/Arc/MetJ family transcriptional regulator
MEGPMTVVSARLPDDLVQSIDKTARAMNRSRSEVICKAVELYLARAEELWSTLDRISSPETLDFDWEDVEGSLLAKD